MHIISGTWDELAEIQQQHEDAANASLTPGQVMLRDDTETTRYWAQPLPDMGLVIYAVCPPVEEDLRDNRARGYLTGTAYSGWEPSGEYGDTHVSQVVPINEDLFEAARLAGFPTWDGLREEGNRALGQALAVAEMFSRNGLPV